MAEMQQFSMKIKTTAQMFRLPIKTKFRDCFQLLLYFSSSFLRLQVESKFCFFFLTERIPRKLKQLTGQLIVCKLLLGGELCGKEGKGLGYPCNAYYEAESPLVGCPHLPLALETHAFMWSQDEAWYWCVRIKSWEPPLHARPIQAN